MKILIICLGLFGLFAQAFNGMLYLGMAVASVSSILLGAILFARQTNKIIVTLALLIIAGCVYDAFAYYTSYHSPGNYYGGWLWSVPTVVCLLVILKEALLGGGDKK
jgi:hypothetical protein